MEILGPNSAVVKNFQNSLWFAGNKSDFDSAHLDERNTEKVANPITKQDFPINNMKGMVLESDGVERVMARSATEGLEATHTKICHERTTKLKTSTNHFSTKLTIVPNTTRNETGNLGSFSFSF